MRFTSYVALGSTVANRLDGTPVSINCGLSEEELGTDLEKCTVPVEAAFDGGGAPYISARVE